MKTDKEKIEIMQAFIDGKTIESCRSNCKWHVDVLPSWDWVKEDYRIKDRNKLTPEQQEILDKIRAGKEAEVYSKEANMWIEVNYRPQYDDYLKSVILEGNEFRFKSEKKIVPYDNAFDFILGMKNHGPYLTDGKGFYFPNSIDDNGIVVTDVKCMKGVNCIFYDYMKDHFTWEDGTVCGKIKNND